MYSEKRIWDSCKQVNIIQIIQCIFCNIKNIYSKNWDYQNDIALTCPYITVYNVLWHNFVISHINHLLSISHRFRVFHRPICLQHDRIEAVVMACCVLHNLILTNDHHSPFECDREDPDTHELIPGHWRDDQPVGSQLPRLLRNTAIVHAKIQCDHLREYCNSPLGSVPCQDAMVT